MTSTEAEIHELTEMFKESLFAITGNEYEISIRKKGEINNYQILNIIKDLLPKYYPKTFNQINVVSRKREIVEPRQHMIYLLSAFTTYTQNKIGSIFSRGGNPMDHSTVIHAKQSWQDLMDTDKRKMAIHKLFEADVRNYLQAQI